MHRHQFALSVLMLVLLAGVQPVAAAPLPHASPGRPRAVASPMSAIQTVFIILMENHNWADIHGSASAPYLNSLLPIAAHAENYHNPTNLHPSLPNYLWLEAGTNFGITDDNPPSMDHQSTTQHLTTLLGTAGISWKAYEENISGTDCPLTDNYPYGVRHDPFVYFDDVTNTNSSTSANCIAHIRPYTELATDLTNHTIARYNFITPNVCDDMHDSAGCATKDSIKNGDTWLSQQVPQILNSAAYQNNGALFITWDESETSGPPGANPPIGMIALSPLMKQGYTNSLAYTHSSTLRTFEEIFAVTPLLGNAANATDLSDFLSPISPLSLPRPAGPIDPAPVLPVPPTRPPSGPSGVGTPRPQPLRR